MWTKPTSTDSQLHQALSTSAIVDRSEVSSQAGSNEAQEQSSEIDLMTSLGIAQFSPNNQIGSLFNHVEYREENIVGGTTDNGNHSLSGARNPATNSDTFLNGILTGQWDAYFQPEFPSELPFASDSGFPQLSETSLKETEPPYQRSSPNDPIYNVRRDHSSDGSFTSMPVPTFVGSPTGYGDVEQTSRSRIPQTPVLSTISERTELALVWDNFLKDLGV